MYTGDGPVPSTHTAVPGSAHEYSRAGYNLILLFPIIGLGVIDQDVPAAALLKFPQLYAVGQVGHGPAAAGGRSIGMLCRRTKPRKAHRAATAAADGQPAHAHGTGPASINTARR